MGYRVAAMADMSRVLSAEEAAILVGVSPKTVRRWIVSGRLRADKRGRSFRIATASLAPFMGQENAHGDTEIQDIEDSGQDTGQVQGDMAGVATVDNGHLALVELVRELKTEVVQNAAAAAMWQARAEMLAAQLDQAQLALEAPKSEPMPPEPTPAAEAMLEPARRAWWRRFW